MNAHALSEDRGVSLRFRVRSGVAKVGTVATGLAGTGLAMAQDSAATPATDALAEVAVAGGAIGTAMVLGAAAILVGRWVTAFIAG